MWKKELLKDKEVESNFNDAILKVMNSENSDITDRNEVAKIKRKYTAWSKKGHWCEREAA